MSEDISSKLPWLQHVVSQGPQPLFATISGAHLYGFESADSDYDLRGAFVAPLDQVLRLRGPNETISILEERDGMELDWVAHDLSKFARLMTKRNGYVLEQLFSPLVVHGGPWLDELRTLGEGCVIRHLYHHYNGFVSNQRELLEGGEETAKRLLYCYRVLLTGIHVLRSGEIEANLTALNEEYEVPEIGDLIERKRSGREKGALADGEAASHQPMLDSLQARLDAAFENSQLPDEVTSFDGLDDYVVRARLELGRG
ncbi:MAG: nucleotidyltransferase [bacterium]|nr:nucleotidyltransferase [bacterium]